MRTPLRMRMWQDGRRPWGVEGRSRWLLPHHESWEYDDEDEQPGIPGKPSGAHLALDWSLVIHCRANTEPAEPKPSRTDPKTEPHRAKLSLPGGFP